MANKRALRSFPSEASLRPTPARKPSFIRHSQRLAQHTADGARLYGRGLIFEEWLPHGYANFRYILSRPSAVGAVLSSKALRLLAVLLLAHRPRSLLRAFGTIKAPKSARVCVCVRSFCLDALSKRRTATGIRRPVSNSESKRFHLFSAFRLARCYGFEFRKRGHKPAFAQRYERVIRLHHFSGHIAAGEPFSLIVSIASLLFSAVVLNGLSTFRLRTLSF